MLLVLATRFPSHCFKKRGKDSKKMRNEKGERRNFCFCPRLLAKFTDYSGFALMILLALGIINVTLLLLSLTRKIPRFVKKIASTPHHQ
jgi:hypothetical protein